jgi:serine/threonine protein kinase
MSPDTDPSTLVADVLTGAKSGREHVPKLLGLLDVGDQQVQLGAAAALCAIAEGDPEAVGSLVTRLDDRTDESVPAHLALSYLTVQYPDAVETELDDGVEPLAPRHDVRKSNPSREGSDNRDTGRTTVAGEGTRPGPRRVYTDDEETETEAHDDRSDDDATTLGQRPRAADAEWRSLVEYESRFDELSILAPRDRRRFSDSYRTMGRIDETEYAVSLRLLRGGETDTSEFTAALADRLDEWRSVADADNVVTLYDWHRKPRLWAATEYTDERLTDRERFPPGEAVWHAEALADAVRNLHERGVVHAGIDAASIAYYGNVLNESERQPPLLDNVGLLWVYRRYFDPSEFLDPRYAAPEYYDRRFGRINHATDIYQLGAVCYRIFTGRPPYTGDFESVREAVLSADPPRPSAVADVPPALDDIVGKAMATEKLRRYETARHLRQELRGLDLEAVDGQ